MSTATVIHNSNEACCTIPPVKSDYAPKGSYKSYAGFTKVYVTGPALPADTAIVTVFDIFGFKPQTQQGADILAEQLNAHVVMPDFFEPDDALPVEAFPPVTDADKARLQAFFGGPANPGPNLQKLLRVGHALKADGAKFVGAYGLCWGGKVSVLAGSVPETPFGGIAIVHPAMLSAADSEGLKVPLGIYPSKDEPIEEYEKIVEIVSKNPYKAKNDYKFYKDTFHGFAGARADLDDPDNKKYFEDLYSTLVRFFTNAKA
ncbi:hypothetical protein B0H21DRAFT_694051 [Amylocystis lapponica]|nr:hypothetical protein B0H21DRAFT_694051 [Amylocystis lapponica]